jgi:hypothetical protein
MFFGTFIDREEDQKSSKIIIAAFFLSLHYYYCTPNSSFAGCIERQFWEHLLYLK